MEISLTSIQEPPKTPNVPLSTLREQIKALEAAHLEKGTKLSGRILHVCHYLPILPTLNPSTPNIPSDVITAPATPSNGSAPPISSGIVDELTQAAESVVNSISSALAPSSTTSASAPPPSGTPISSSVPSRWSLSTRRGHTAMVSGIRSLTQTHEQIVIGWTGSIHPSVLGATGEDGNTPELGEEDVSEEDRKVLESEMKNFDVEDEDGQEIVPPAGVPVDAGNKIQYVPVWLKKEVAKGHYEGYCKTTLWPLFHYLLWQDYTSEFPVDDPAFKAYSEANRIFAAKVAEVYQPGDLIFIHDYHLLLAPKMIRELIPEANIGLFVHAPFPSSEIFRCLPRRKEILEGMLGANLVCFQTYSYSRHFLSTCIRVCGFESSATGVDHDGSVTAIGYCPIGIDAERVASDRNRASVLPKIEALRALYKGKKIIVGREKLDVSKGVLEKLEAFERLLESYPEWRGKVVLIQVTQPALSESAKLERAVSELVSHINGVYGSLDFTPVHHYHQTIDRDEYFALLSVADLALITALRDGMNTTSMEFTICQEKTNKAPLVLSEFLGSAASFSSALLINPHDIDGVADAINQGLVMSDEEKNTRHAELYESVISYTSHSWAAAIVVQLLENIDQQHQAHQTPFLDQKALKTKYDGAKKRLLLFDYDGTLTPIVKNPSDAVPTPLAFETITKLTEDPRNVVYLISGRDDAFLLENWGSVKNLGLSAEHGCFVRAPGTTEWRSLTDKLDMGWMSEVKEIFQFYSERTAGAFVEEKKASITWHYRASDPDFGSFQCKQCHDLLESTLAPRRPIEVLVGKKNLEVRPLAINKGEIVKQILYENPDADFVFCAGDDKTDEDMFRSLRTIFPITGSVGPTIMSAPIAVTSTCTPKEIEALKDVELSIHPEDCFSTAVGPPAKKTLARWHVTTPEEVVQMMSSLV